MTGTQPQQVTRFIVARIGGYEANRDFNVAGLNSFENVQTIEALHLDIEEDSRNLLAVIAAMIEGFLGVSRGPDMEAMIVQIGLQ